MSSIQSTQSSASLADRIVDVISGYIYKGTRDDQFEVTGRDCLRRTVSRYLESGEQMELVFPGFPFKSPSAKKVLGKLPDLGEELLLKRLDALAKEICELHPAGAVVRIVSDGIVYGELLGQDDRCVWHYNDGLRQMTEEFDLSCTTFVRVVDLLDKTPTSQLDVKVMLEDEYVSSIPIAREAFLAHEIPGYDLEASIKNDSGTLWTYRGYLKFLESDLEGSHVMAGPDGKPLSGKGQDKKRRVIAKQMLRNGAKFSDLVALKFPEAIRLSVHAHNNAGPKFAFDLFPGFDMSASPWHNVVMEKADGKFAMGQVKSFDPATYDIVEKDGQAYYLKERA